MAYFTEDQTHSLINNQSVFAGILQHARRLLISEPRGYPQIGAGRRDVIDTLIGHSPPEIRVGIGIIQPDDRGIILDGAGPVAGRLPAEGAPEETELELRTDRNRRVEIAHGLRPAAHAHPSAPAQVVGVKMLRIEFQAPGIVADAGLGFADGKFGIGPVVVSIRKRGLAFDGLGLIVDGAAVVFSLTARLRAVVPGD